jgi:hypothetical protein
MPEFIVIVKNKGDPQPHCAIPVTALDAQEIIARLERSAPLPPMREKPITILVSPPPADLAGMSKRQQNETVWRERLATLGTHRGAVKEFCERFRCQPTNVQYWLRKFRQTAPATGN